MLFDLRSRGRRRTVQAVYLGLAVLMGGGLILFGVGAGNGFGGILNAFNGGGGSSAQKQQISQAQKTALAQTRAAPNNPAGWANLVEARWSDAGQGSDYNASAGTFTAAGKHELLLLTQAWQRYQALTKNPNSDVAILAARAYAQLGQYANEANAWDVESLSTPNEAKGFECMAAASFAAKETRKAQLALAKALALSPKAERKTLKQEITAAQTTPQIAQQC